MKRIAVLIIAVIAASACMASAGVSTSAATAVLCKENEEPCKYVNLIPEGTKIVAEAKETADRVNIATPPFTIKCAASTLEATVGSGSVSTRNLSINKWTLGTCTGITSPGDCGEAPAKN